MKIILKEDKIVCYYSFIYNSFIYNSFIYNNICVYIEPKGYNDSVISIPYIEYKYVKFQINICDLNAIKKAFIFLNKT